MMGRCSDRVRREIADRVFANRELPKLHFVDQETYDAIVSEMGFSGSNVRIKMLKIVGVEIRVG